MPEFPRDPAMPAMPASHPHWSTILVAGRACELFSPPDPVPGRAMIWLHDLAAERLCDSAQIRDMFDTARVPVLAPQSGRSWWLDRPMPGFTAAMTPERHVVEAVRGEVERRCGVRPPGIALVGAGMGGQGALRIAYRHPSLFPVAAAVAPAIDFHRGMREAGDHEDGERFDTLWEAFGDVERARQDTAILHVHPLNWPRHQCFVSDPADARWHDGADRLHSKLVALGIPHTAVFESRADFTAAAAAAVTFALDALDQEARRLPAS